MYQYRLWGGRRLADILSAPLPGDGPIGEAWILSDRDDHPSLVADGPLKGKTIKELLDQWPHQLMGGLAGQFSRFPLLLKFLDVRKALSVQVHPSDAHLELIPPGENGKTEAWVVLEADAESRIYAGLKAGTTADNLRGAIANGKVEDHLAYFTPKPGDAVLVQAGTVHSLNDVVVFEVQENSDVTFRLYDWNHVDPQTGQHRPLQVDQALACIDYMQVVIGPVVPGVVETAPALRERLFLCDHFGVWRISGEGSFSVGKEETPRVLVCIAGAGHLEHFGTDYAFAKGDVVLLPAVVGDCLCRPHGEVTLLQISLPKGSGIR
ncbi:MAG: type I phosphomannose isomerase catalytic subunit [Chthoniobacteraceae bacterium]